MKYIKDITPRELKAIKTNAFESKNKDLMFIYLEAPCTRESNKSRPRKWNPCTTFSKGPNVGKDYISAVYEYNDNIYVIQSNGISHYRFAFSR